MAKKKAVRDVKGPAEETPSDSGQIELVEGNISKLVVKGIFGVASQLKRIADVLEKKYGGPE
jgi:hypothetical protein